MNMDFVKREDHNVVDDENYKLYLESLQKSHQMEPSEYQHTPISMEQLHQVMQSSLNASTIVHNFQLPLSPRQMSTLMLKTNHLSRNLNFNEIQPAHLPRNLSEMDISHALVNDLPQGLRHDDILSQNLSRGLDISLVRTLGNELELHNGLAQTLAQNLSEQELRLNEVNLPQNLRTDLPHDLSHEIGLSHHMNRQNMEQEMMSQEDPRRTPMMQCPDQLIEQNVAQRLEQSLAQRLEQNLAQRLDQNLAQRLDPGLAQRLEQTVGPRLVNNMLHDRQMGDSEHMLPISFQIKSEQEDDGYFYDNINQGMNGVNGINGHLHAEHSQASQAGVPTDSPQMYSVFSPQVPNIPALNPIDLYSRPPNYPQNYVNVPRENPQNLVVHKQFDPFDTEMKKLRHENGENHPKGDCKNEEPKENLKPTDQNKLFYTDYNNSYSNDSSKSENDPAQSKLNDELSMNIRGEYVCYKCNEMFPSKRGLKQHSKSCVDNGETSEKIGKFGCTQCSYRCQSPAILKIHERTHSGEKPFSCTFCDYKSGQKNNVAKHILVHMKEKPFRCQYCDYRCAQKNNLVVHERTHTGYKPFACPYCDYRTVQKPNLVKHMYLHTDQKPFSCDVCSYRCVQKTNLTKHKQRHLNEKDGEKVDIKSQIKPYRPRQKSVKCTQCPYRCVQKSSMEKHIQFKHNGQDILRDGYADPSVELDNVQNLSVKKDETVFVDACQEKMDAIQMQA